MRLIMQRDDALKSLMEIEQQLSLQSQEFYIYHDIYQKDTDRPALINLPNDIKKLICTRYLNGIDAFNFFKSARRPLLVAYPMIAQRKDNPLRTLLNQVALGELEAAEKIWKSAPHLLTERGTIYHPNCTYVAGQPTKDIPFQKNPGRYKYVKCTALQILLMNAEFEEAKRMAKLMPIEAVQKQVEEVFPDGEIKKYAFDLNKAQKLLKAVFNAVSKDKRLKIERDTNYNIKNILISDATRLALMQLYTYTKPRSEHEKGLVFDPQFYLAALNLYDDLLNRSYNFRMQTIEGNAFWNICVEEWLAGCLGTFFLRAHSQGLDNLPDRRGCVLSDGSPYFAFRRAEDSLPGATIFVGSSGKRDSGRGPYWVGRPGGAGEQFHVLCQATTRAGTDFIRQYCTRKSRPV